MATKFSRAGVHLITSSIGVLELPKTSHGVRKHFPFPAFKMKKKTNFTSSLSFRTGTYPRRLGPGQHSGTLYASVRLRLSVLAGVLSVPLTPAPDTALLPRRFLLRLVTSQQGDPIYMFS